MYATTPVKHNAITQMQADFSAAKQSRTRRQRMGIYPLGSSADYHYANWHEFIKLLEDARDAERNDAIVSQMITKVVNNTVKTGYRQNPDTGDEKLDAELVELFDEWADDPDLCDVQGEMTFEAMQRMAFRRVLVDGDILALPLSLDAGGQLQLKEAHELCSPNYSPSPRIIHGVELDDFRRRRGYWFRTGDPGQPGKVKIERMDARDADNRRQVFHVYNPERSSQTRGVTVFRAVFDEMTNFGDLNYYKIIQAMVVSCVGFYFKSNTGNVGVTNPDSNKVGEQRQESMGGRFMESMYPGIILRPPPGVELAAFSPQVPNPEFFPHAKLILTIVGNAIGLPLVMVLMDASETNFSGYRGAIDQARIGFQANQQMLLDRFHSPVWLWKVSHFIEADKSGAMRRAAEGRKRKKVNIYRHTWDTPSWPYIEPTKDAQADILRLDNNLISPRQLQAERGRDWPQLCREIVEDRAKLIRRAVEEAEIINKEFPKAKVDWRELCNMTLKDKPLVEGDEPEPGRPSEGKATDGS